MKSVASDSTKPATAPLTAWSAGWAGHSWLTGPLAAFVILAVFWGVLLASIRYKSLTNDEGGHATAGYTYWRFNDYRIDPENGNLPQRFMALPLIFGRYVFPTSDSIAWRTSEQWDLANEWFYHLGNNADEMLRRGRAANSIFTIVLGALVWCWARNLFGFSAATLALLLFVLSPTILANGALMTSDAAASLFFLASTRSIWAVLERVSPRRVVVSGLMVGALFATKTSAVLIIPIGLILLLARLANAQPLVVEIGPRREVASKLRQVIWFGAVGLVQVLIALTLVWACYGFRYAALKPSAGGRLSHPWEFVFGRPAPKTSLAPMDLTADQKAAIRRIAPEDRLLEQWSYPSRETLLTIKQTVLAPAQAAQLDSALASPPPAMIPRIIDFFNRHHLLPEAYCYGQANAWRFMQGRNAFLNGESSIRGWPSFFPYTFLVKTPLPVFAFLALAIAATVLRWKAVQGRDGTRWIVPAWRGVYDTLPLWVFIICYWAAVIPSHLNIGHRHIMPVYPALYILCGAMLAPSGVAGSGERIRLRRAFAGIAAGLFILLAAEIGYRFPNYLAYFNALAGGPAHGYRHLVDSSLDWGQDLPALRDYIDKQHPVPPLYLSYFGNASPVYYKIPARLIRSIPGLDARESPSLAVHHVAADQAGTAISRLLREHPDYSHVGSGRSGDNINAILLKNPVALRLSGGTYFISASMLQPIHEPWGPWNARFEAIYQEVSRAVRPLLSDDPETRQAVLPGRSPREWREQLDYFEIYRFARLAAFLRRREPDDTINFSILVYRLTDADLVQALDGPPPELGPDMPALTGRK